MRRNVSVRCHIFYRDGGGGGWCLPLGGKGGVSPLPSGVMAQRSICVSYALTDLGDARDTHPLVVQFFSYSCSFHEKMVKQ